MSFIQRNIFVIAMTCLVLCFSVFSIHAQPLKSMNVYVWNFTPAEGQADFLIVKFFVENLPDLFTTALQKENCFGTILERQNVDQLLYHRDSEKKIIEITGNTSSGQRTILEADAVIFVKVADDGIEHVLLTAKAENFNGAIISQTTVPIKKKSGLDLDILQEKMQELAHGICQTESSGLSPDDPGKDRRVPILYSSGTACIGRSNTFDLDLGKISPQGGDDMFFNSVDGIEQYLTPWGGSSFSYLGNVDFARLSLQDLEQSQYGIARLNATMNTPNHVTPGNVFLVETGEGRFAKVRVDQFGDYMKFTWETYAKEGEGALPNLRVTSAPCSIEEALKCETGKASGDAITHFRILDRKDQELLIEVDYTYNSVHGKDVYFGAYLLDADGNSLSHGYFPTAAPTANSGTVRLNVSANKYQDRVRSEELFIWMYEPYKGESFICRRFPYSGYWN